MATTQDAELILKLYDLRREAVMRKARQFVFSEFFPQSFADIKALWEDHKHPEHGAYLRQVTSYWDMAAALVNHGAVNAELFFDTNGEYLAVWAKLVDFVPEIRESFGQQYLANLEKLIKKQPNSEARINFFKERFKQFAAMRAAQAQKS